MHRDTQCSTDECDATASGFDNPQFHRLHYEWRFGDSGAGTWAASNQSKNVEYGPIAAHVYHTPGTYNIRTIITSDTDVSDTSPITIYVDDPDDAFATTTRCISNSANHDGCPVTCPSADCVTSSDFDAALATAIAANDRRILFKAGDTFVIDATHSIAVDGPAILGSYGTANDGRAIIDSSGYTGNVVYVANNVPGNQADYWVFKDLEVTSHALYGHFYDRDGGRQFRETLFYNLKKLGGGSGITILNAPFDNPPRGGATGIFLVENELSALSSSDPDFKGYPIFMGTQGGGILGNIIGDGSTRGHHPFRINRTWRDMLISHNETKCCYNSAATIRGDQNDQVTPAQFMVVRGNLFRDTAESVNDAGAVTVRPTQDGNDERMQDIIIENNRFHAALRGLSAKTVTVRNNLFVNSQWNNALERIDINNEGACALPDDWVDDIMVYNNSAYRADDPSANYEYMIRINDVRAQCVPVLSDTHVFYNNLMWSPLSTNEVVKCEKQSENRGYRNYCGTVTPAPTDSGGSSADHYTEFPTNLDATHLSSSPFASDTPDIETVSDWYLTGLSASTVIDQGQNLGTHVHTDYENTVRPRGTGYDIGAIEQQ
jgi:hypothetical protein